MYPSIDRTLSPRVYGDVSYHTEGEGSTPKVQTKLQVVTYTDGYYYRAGGGGLALVDGWIDISCGSRARPRDGWSDRSESEQVSRVQLERRT